MHRIDDVSGRVQDLGREAAAQEAPARAGECPECGAKGAVSERATRSNGEVADLMVCAECGAAWEVDQ